MRERKQHNNHRYLRVHPNRTFNDWDVIERQVSDATTVDLTEIEQHLADLDASQQEQDKEIAAIASEGVKETWIFEVEDGTLYERTVKIYDEEDSDD